jgi:hypothetical protein
MIATIYFFMLTVCCGYALVKGGPPERVCAWLMMFGTALTMIVLPGPSDHYRHFEIGLFGVDLSMFFGFALLSIRSHRFWPMWISSMQLVAVLSHVTPLIAHGPLPWAYAMAIQCWSYPMLIMLAWGTARHRGRVRRFKWDPSWVDRPRLAP